MQVHLLYHSDRSCAKISAINRDQIEKKKQKGWIEEEKLEQDFHHQQYQQSTK